jgi:hypothetical protein
MQTAPPEHVAELAVIQLDAMPGLARLSPQLRAEIQSVVLRRKGGTKAKEGVALDFEEFFARLQVGPPALPLYNYRGSGRGAGAPEVP